MFDPITMSFTIVFVNRTLIKIFDATPFRVEHGTLHRAKSIENAHIRAYCAPITPTQPVS